ncbi:transcription factor S [Natronobacterium texcoconense]|uniref:Transcription factor S n=1 Tax=Natronobacterium texcoconense TaxID=1095778 RepID=A0A1H1C8T8_NATTX|nr:transcription factor S [Natronobacterium texcoconense]SDQ60603.1 DNA-directed RNA polymerase, subunit M [Natronobacterium texcoconense]
MQFCDDCGSMMKADGDHMVCTNDECGVSSERDRDREDEFVTTESQTDTDVIESSEDANFEGKPKATDVICDECGNQEAWYTLKQTASADEPPTRFFKCTECGHRWRGYN